MQPETPKLDMYNEDSLNLKFLFSLVRKNFKFLVFCTLLPALLTSAWSLTLPNMYTAKAILTSKESGNQNLSSDKGIASFTNIRIEGQATKADEAFEVIRSLEFFTSVMLNNYPIEHFIGGVSWDSDSNTLSLEPIGNVHDLQAAHRNFLRANLQLGKNEDTGFYFIGITHVSPYEATKMTNTIIQAANQIFSDREAKQSQAAFDFMQSRLEGTMVPEVKSVFADIMKMHVQKLAFIESNQDYVFQELSSAYAPNIKSGPFRSLYVLLAIAIGGLIGVLISYLRTIELDP